MPKKRRKTIVIILTILTIGIGGKFYMDKREAQRQKDLLAVEKQSVKVLKNTFADIREVKIERTGYNNITGFYHITVILTNIEGKSVTFDYGFIKNDTELSGFAFVNEKIQKEGKTKNKIKVIYSNEEEEII
ncbi:hypothetical protein G8B28_01815 [Enterococcus faecium]|uniref:hypothetical protein n=1 Tax=Enterococcus faecium TaxID=1352 RepID=UPI0018840255|nr:hypothetical protein [Enterococcus faecium]EME7087287.1 hypothetical protein [Enterococcus faecium]MBE9857998.1 hypothetical protein [Enterococcus faecium]MBE9882047.1 hypothetical protein [Enterococcus faecium]